MPDQPCLRLRQRIAMHRGHMKDFRVKRRQTWSLMIHFFINLFIFWSYWSIDPEYLISDWSHNSVNSSITNTSSRRSFDKKDKLLSDWLLAMEVVEETKIIINFSDVVSYFKRQEKSGKLETSLKIIHNCITTLRKSLLWSESRLKARKSQSKLKNRASYSY